MRGSAIARARSLLFVPADERRLGKVGRVGADAYVVDLEDSVAEGDKDAALGRAVAFLRGGACGASVLVRVNKGRHAEEMLALRDHVAGFVLPKFDSPSDYGDAERLAGGSFVVALAESAAALLSAPRVAALPWVGALAFGAQDFTTGTGFADEPGPLAVPKALLCLAAKACGKPAFDTPCFRLGDEGALDAELSQARSLGFDGKLAIHPRQVAPINAAFGPRDAEGLRRVIEAYEASGEVVCEVDGVVYEPFHIERMRRELLASRREVS